MSWVEAAWTVKRIEEDLGLSQSINTFVDQINELHEDILQFEEEYPVLENIDTPAELEENIQNISTQINNLDNNFSVQLINKKPFFDTVMLNENNQIEPQHYDTTSIIPNTVWFIVDEWVVEEEEEEENG